MNQTRAPLYKAIALAGLVLASGALSGCVYRIGIQQGNYLEQEQIEQVEVGMSRSAVEFLLGTPTINDPFHESRWDYPYYLKAGRTSDVQRSWVVVWFEGDAVSRIERDVTLDPSS